MPSNLEAAIGAGCEAYGEAFYKQHPNPEQQAIWKLRGCKWPKCSAKNEPCYRLPATLNAMLRAFLSFPPSDEEVKIVSRQICCPAGCDSQRGDGNCETCLAGSWVDEARAALQASREHMLKEIGE